MTGSVNWLFGRGLSVACGLGWIVPPVMQALPREEKIARIKAELCDAMGCANVDTSIIRKLFAVLHSETISVWRHRFITTNWDCLLQHELTAYTAGDPYIPKWLANSHVYHLNGTVEELKDSSQRSPFLLEEDPATQRCSTHEANNAFKALVESWPLVIVVVGMSFECETDRFLLSAMKRVERDFLVGESSVVIVNPNESILEKSSERLQKALPRAFLFPVKSAFGDWLDDGLPELHKLGILVDRTSAQYLGENV